MSDPLWQALILLLIAAVAVQAIVLIAVMRQLGGILIQLRPARIGELPEQGPEAGRSVDISGLPLGRPAVVLFVSPSCGLCKPLLPAIGAIRRVYGDQLEVLAAIIGAGESERELYARELGEAARTDLAHLEQEWRVPGTPFVVGIDRENKVYKSGVVNSLDQLEGLVEEIRTERAVRSGETEAPTDVPAAAATAGNGARSTTA